MLLTKPMMLPGKRTRSLTKPGGITSNMESYTAMTTLHQPVLMATPALTLMPEVAVYTAEFGGHDAMLEPQAINPFVRYVYFTDQHKLSSSVWEIRCVPAPFADPRRSSRYYFDQSCRAISTASYTIMHGANSSLTADPLELIREHIIEPDVDVATFAHPHRDCIYDEAVAVLEMGKDVPETVMPQMDRYRADGFPSHYGLHACTLMLRRNTPAMREFERLWWGEVYRGSHRDQLSFDYIRWKLDFKVGTIPGDVFSNDIIEYHIH